MLFYLISIFIIILLLFFKNNLWVKNVIFYTKYVILYVWVAVCCLGFLPLLILMPYCDENGRLVSVCITWISKVICMKCIIRNEGVLPSDSPAVIVANHQSAFDILGLCKLWIKVKRLAPVAKRSFIYSGPVAFSGYLCGFVYIHRNDSKKAYENLNIIQKALTNKYKTMMFVEGTRNRLNDGRLLPFKKGAFNMAVTAQVPIIPVVYSPYYFIDKKQHIFNRGELVLQCLEPIPTVGLTKDDVPALVERVHEMMSQTYKQLWEEAEKKKENL